MIKKCPYCKQEFKTHYFFKKYCSRACQKGAYQRRKDKSYPEGQFQWLNSRWSPTPLEDRIWARTGFESVGSYLNNRLHYLTPKEIAQEIDTNHSEIKTLCCKYKVKKWLRYY